MTPSVAISLRRAGFFLVLCILGVARSGYAQTFRTGTSVPTLHHPNSIALGDFTGDGIVDMAVPFFDPHAVRIMRGDGAGRFTVINQYNLPGGPRASIATDLNGDGKLDLIVSNQVGNSVSVLIGLGGGAFSNAVNYPVGAAPYVVVAADFNRDGKTDVATANADGGTVSVLLGNGAGAFGTQVQYAVGATPRAIAVADFTGDNKPDLAVANFDGASISILAGDGSGNFVAASELPTGSGPYMITTADLDADGRPDLLVPNYNVGTTSIYFGGPSGTFVAGPVVATGSGPRHAAAADVNADGKLDVIVSNRDDASISVLLGDGAGAYAAPLTTGVGAGPFMTVVHDFNRDGAADIAVVERDNDTYSILPGNGTGAFPGAFPISTASNPRGLTAADFNQDNKLDLATANNYGNSTTVVLGDGSGGAAAVATYAAARAPGGVVAADLNGDGFADLAVSNGSNNNISVLLNTGTGAFGAARNFSVGNGPRSLAVADFNGDGRPDLVGANYNGHNVGLLLNNGAGVFSAPSVTAVGTNPSSIVAADFNRDGKMDIAVTCVSATSVVVLLGNGAGGFAAPVAIATGAEPMAVAAFDMDEDGILDLGVANFAAASLSLFRGLGNGQFANAGTLPAGAGPLAVTSGDFDGDGHIDLVTAAAVGNAVVVMRGRGDGTFDAGVSYTAGLYPRSLVAADFTGDGKIDIAVGNATSDDVRILVNTSAVSGTAADLSVAISDGLGSVAPGQAVTYTIVVANAGPAAALGAIVQSTVLTGLENITWSCAASPGSSCPASGAGALNHSIDLPPAGTATYTMSATVSASATGTVQNRVVVSTANVGDDPAPANNSASDTNGVAVPGNLAPVASGQTVSGTEDQPSAITLTASDPNGDPLTWTILTLPAHGTLSGSAPALTYTPAANYSGPDGFTFKVNDGAADSAAAQVSIVLAAVNDAPTAGSQSVTTAKNTPLPLVLSGSDVDGDGLTFTVASQPANGTLSGSGANLTYTPVSGFTGTDAFTFTVSDGVLTSAAAVVSISVTQANSAPVVANPMANVTINGTATSTTIPLANVFGDADLGSGDALTLTVRSNSNSGLATPSIAGGNLVVNLANVSGSTTIVVRATDNAGAFAEDDVVITVTRPQGGISIGDASVTEGNAGTKTMTFTLTLSSAPSSPVTVGYTAVSDTAIAGSDFNAASGTVTFAAGQTSRTLGVIVLGDTIDEVNETLRVVLSNPVGATIGDGEGIGTIVDDDTSAVSIADAAVVEGDSGTAAATFTLNLSTPNSRPITVQFATANTTAIAGADYVAASGVATIPAGATSTTIVVEVLGDTLDETNENFAVTISNPVNANLGRVKGVGVITDDDEPPTVSIDDVVVTENNGTVSATFTLTLSAVSGQTVRVQWATANGTAVAGSDYRAQTGDLQFLAGVTSRTISIVVTGDRVAEATENFFVNLVGATGAVISDGQGLATVIDDDGTL